MASCGVKASSTVITRESDDFEMPLGSGSKEAPEWDEVDLIENHENWVSCKYCNLIFSSKAERIKTHLQKCLKRKTQNTGSAGEDVDLEILGSEESTTESSGTELCCCCCSSVSLKGVDHLHHINTKLSQQLEDVEQCLSLPTSAEQEPHRHHHHHYKDNTQSLSDSSQPLHDLTNEYNLTSSPHHTHNHSTPLPRSFSASSSPLKTSSQAMHQKARPSPGNLHAQVLQTTLRSMGDLCTSMADVFHENSSLHRSMLEQNRASSQDAYTSVLREVQQMHSTIKEIQAQLQAVAADVEELRAMRAAAATPSNLPEVAEVNQSEEVPVDIPAASFKFIPSSIATEGGSSTASPAPSFGFKCLSTPSIAAITTTLLKTTPSTATASITTSSSSSTASGFKFTLSDTATTSPSVSIATPSATITTTAATTTTTTAGTSKDSGTAGNGNIFGGMSPAFGNLASCASTTTASSIFTTKAFEPQTSVGSIKSPQKDDNDDHVEENEPQVDIQPMVLVPDVVELKTDEMGEEVLFCERSKLFCFDKDSKEWKERANGYLKILRNSTSGKVRVFMRRELTVKVCANHFITSGIKLAPMPSSDKAWIWAAHNFVGEEMRKEEFAAEFKTEELALAFKEAFEKAQQMVKSTTTDQSAATSGEPVTKISTTTITPSLGSLFPQPVVGNTTIDASCVSCNTPKSTQGYQKNLATSEEESKSISLLAGMFQPPAGSWECEACLWQNETKSQVCVACAFFAPVTESLKCQAINFSKGQPSTSASNTSSALSPGNFKFGEESKQTFTFGGPQNQQPVNTKAQPAFTFGLKTSEDSTGKPASFSFGINTTFATTGISKVTTTTTKNAQPALSFGSSTNPTNKPFAFTRQPPTSSNGPLVTFAPTQPVEIPSTQHEEVTTTQSATIPTKENKAGFVFGSPGKHEFSFSGVKAKSPRARDPEESVVEEDGDYLYFKPVVSLLDKVEVVTEEEEEEDEEVLYAHHAELYCLTKGEWKERGIGDIKIVSHNKTAKVRLIMCREQMHDLCLDHCLEKDLEMQHKDDKTFYWTAMDHSEAGAPKLETFSICFKTPEIAAEFFGAVNDAKVKQEGTATEVSKVE